MARSTWAMLALAAATAVNMARAQVPFNPPNGCTALVPDPQAATVVTDGDWSCAAFSLAKSDDGIMTFDVAAADSGARLQVYAWNKDRGEPDGHTMWSPPAVNWMTFVKSQNGQTDTNGMSNVYAADRWGTASAGVSLTALLGWTDNEHNNGVYAYYGEVSTCTGRNWLRLVHPDNAVNGSVSSFEGQLLYRFVAAGDTSHAATIVPSAAVDQTAPLTQASPVSVNYWMSPGSSITIPVAEEFATAGYALKGFGWTITVNPTTTSDNPVVEALGWELPLPAGYTAWPHANSSYGWGPGNTAGNLATADGQPLYYNYTNNQPGSTWSPFGRVEGGKTYSSPSAGEFSLNQNYTLPLDAAPVTAGFGYLTLTVPSVRNVQDPTQQPYNWQSQASPFWSVTIHLARLDTFPMLSSLSDLTLRNYDTDSNKGHSVADTQQQKPFEVYMVNTLSPLWWRWGAGLGTATDLNRPAGVNTDVPAPRPNVEFQVVSDWTGIRANGWGAGKWTNANPGDAQFAGYELEDFAYPWVVNKYWRSAKVNQHVGATLPPLTPDRKLWFLVRVSATKAVTGETGTEVSCGSDHLSIPSAAPTFDSVADQCSDYSGCLVENNPNALQVGLSANADPSRFSTCLLREVAHPSGVAALATKCVECRSDDHCDGGQYCHVDNGLCGGNTVCDATSYPKFGLCIKKSSDVLGRRCRPNVMTADAGTPPVSTPSTSAVVYPGATAGAVQEVPQQVSGVPVAPLDLFVVPTPPSAGTNFTVNSGYCGDFLYTSTETASGFAVPASVPRATLWLGFCSLDQVCMECEPGASKFGEASANGKVCRNGALVRAGDPISENVGLADNVDVNVDGGNGTSNSGSSGGSSSGGSSAQSVAEDTEDDEARAADLLAALVAILVLGIFFALLLLAVYIYASAQRYRKGAGLAGLTCLETLACCGMCCEPSASSRRRTVSGAPVTSRSASMSTTSPLSAAITSPQPGNDASRGDRVAAAGQPAEA